MKLVTFDAGQGPRTGAVAGERIADLSAAGLPAGMTALIADWAAHKARAAAALSAAAIPLSAVRLLPPVPRPGKILAIGLNYADHIAETGRETPAHQTWFCKQPTAANGPFDPIVLPKNSAAVDYEAELVAVIGARCRHTPRERARAAIFGYMAGNDVSARDWQYRTPQWMLGKSFDSHAPMGPWIVTADEIADPHALGVRCFVNGALRQDSNTRHLIFKLEDQIAELSSVMTLEPGDVIFTGTPGGVGAAMKPPAFLKAGDRVRIEIERIGAIEAECAAER